MSEQVGYQLIDTDKNVIESWGGIWGQNVSSPDLINLPNGDVVYAPKIDTDYSGYTLTKWMMDAPPTPPPLTPDEKLAALGLTVTELKELLGL